MCGSTAYITGGGVEQGWQVITYGRQGAFFGGARGKKGGAGSAFSQKYRTGASRCKAVPVKGAGGGGFISDWFCRTVKSD